MEEEGSNGDGDGGGYGEAEVIIWVRVNCKSKFDFDFLVGQYNCALRWTIYLSDPYCLFEINSPDRCGLVLFGGGVIIWVEVIFDLSIFDDFTITVFRTLELLLESGIPRIYDN